MPHRIEMFKHGTCALLWWYCPGCEGGHGVTVGEGEHFLEFKDTRVKVPIWGWNGSFDSPTITPSILARGVITCHCFVTDGVIEFLADSQHKLAGQKVPLDEVSPEDAASSLKVFEELKAAGLF